MLETDVETCVFLRVDKIPELGLWLGKNANRSGPPWMDLERESLGSIQDLDQDWETGRVVPFAENLVAIVIPDFVQRSPAKFRLRDDALGIFAIDELPGFANLIFIRKCTVEVGLQFATAPNSLHVQWLKC